MTCPVCKGSGEVALMVRCGAAYEKRVTVCPECEGSQRGPGQGKI